MGNSESKKTVSSLNFLNKLRSYCPFLSFIRIAALDVQNHHGRSRVYGVPNTFGRLPDSGFAVKLFESSAKKCI